MRPKSKERATKRLSVGDGVDSKHSNEYPFAENACWDNPKPLTERRCGNGKPKEKDTDEVLRYGRRKAADRREDEAASHKADGAYFRKMAIDGYILVVDRSDTKAYIRELQAVSRNINQIANAPMRRGRFTGRI